MSVSRIEYIEIMTASFPYRFKIPLIEKSVKYGRHEGFD